MKVRTMNGTVHYVLFNDGNGPFIACPPPVDEKIVDGRVAVVRTDEPVNCIHCIANPPQAKKP